MGCRRTRGWLALLPGLVALATAAGAQTPPPARTAPKPAPPSATELEVVVLDTAGKPVEGAFVVVAPVTGAWRSGGGFAPDKTRSGFTSGDGRVKLETLPPAPWNAWVHARGFVAQPVRRITGGPVRVRLERGGTVAGVVREGDGGRPVPGARVGFESDLPAPDAWRAEAVRSEAVTDAEGRFRLEGVGRAAVRLVARAPGYSRASRADVRAGASVELFLFAGATLSGVVRDEGGRPVRGATVRVEGDTSWSAPPPERTDARGEFVVAGIAPGEYTVVAREGGRAPGIAAVVVPPEGEATADIVLSEGAFVTGRVVDPEGRPLVGRARVEVFEGKALPPFASDLMAAEVRTDGTFALGPVPLGALGVAISAPRHAARRIEADVRARDRAADLGDVVLDRGLAIRGRVRDRDGAGVAGADVRAFAQGPGATGEAAGESAADGGFELGGLPPGRYEVSASATGYGAGQATAEAGGEPVDLVLDVGGGITGRVADESGASVEDARVSARDESQPGGWRVFSVRSDEGDGRFAMRDVAPGAYDVEVQAGERGEATRAEVKVAAGRTSDLGTIVLARGGTVEGLVVDGEGRGVAGATVSAEREANVRTGRRETQTGSSGAFVLRGLRPGPAFLTARHPSYASSSPVEVGVDPERETTTVQIVLARGGRIEGRALHRDGRPFTAGRIQAWPFAGRVGRDWGSGALDAGGAFVLEHVPPGRTNVQLMAFTPASPMASGSGMSVLTSIDGRELVVREGETSTADFALRDVVVSGRVTRGGQGEPGVLVGVMARRAASVMAFAGATPASAVVSGPPPLAAVTREDGFYELLVFAPGPAYVEMSRGPQSFGGRQEEIPDVDRFTLDLEIASAAVAGVVVDRETGEPVAEARVSLRPEEQAGRAGGGSAQTGPDGRFSIAAEPGEYLLLARAHDRAPLELPLSVGAAGVVDLRVELEDGLVITGRLVDGSGRAAAGHLLNAAAADGVGGGYANSSVDGSFRIVGLGAGPHALVGGSELAGLGFLPGVVPGGEPVVLALRPAARIAVRVVDATGRPVAEAFPRVETVDGVRVRLPGRTSGPTDADGLFELASPAGRVEVVAGHETGRGHATVDARSGERADVTIVLGPNEPKD